jgi:hypothetical protein
MNAHSYSSDFYSYIDAGSRNSARVVSSLLLDEMPIASLLDVGGGHGAWAREWLRAGVSEALVVDGSYVSSGQLVIPGRMFEAHDLSRPVDIGRRFDLVQSLEVAEHISSDAADTFIGNLVRHGDVVLFSAAVPHQGGEHHVNEQPPEYWRAKFAEHGYEAYDWLRPQLAERREVMPWYRYNCFLYANAAGAARLSTSIRDSHVANDQPLKIGGDLAWALRRSAVRLIPEGLVKPIAMSKAVLEARIRRARPRPASI